MNLEDLYRLLRAGHVQAQGIVDTLDEPLLVLDQNLCVLSGNTAFFQTFCVSKDETVGQPLFSLGARQWDIPELRRLLGEVLPRSAAVIGYEVTQDFPALGRRTMLVSARRLVQPDSASSNSLLVLFEDITERRRIDAEKDILLAETRHRMKNLLATVRALANQTQADGRTGVEYRDAFLGRFETLMAAQSATLSGADAADFAEIVERAAALARSDDAFVRRGPPVPLAPRQVLPLSLVVHELTTNALKYGALSTGAGRVTVEWSLTPRDAGGRTLALDWREEGGPPVPAERRAGFGSQLIEFSVRYDLGGTADLHYEPQGFHAAISAPIG
jgi:two-component sensor histidine kinase